MRFGNIGLVVTIAVGTPAAAAVQSVTPYGFAVSSTVSVAVSPATAYAALIQPDRWWNSAHTYSRDAANLSLDVKAGGCFCEKMPKNGGQAEHMRVVNVVPGQMLRLRGALGPLQGQGVDGALTWTLKPAGTGTEISVTYVVGGYFSAGMEQMASPVDEVIGDQLTRLKAYAETGKP